MSNLGTNILMSMLLLTGLFGRSQTDVNIQWTAENEYPALYSALTPVADVLGRPYLYVTSNELGLKIFDVSSQLDLVATLDTLELTNRPMSVTQRDTLLYVCIGTHFGESTEPAGIAIINVANPELPVVLNVWTDTVAGNGTGIVKLQGDFAYVGAMSQGLIILNISDPMNISYVSRIIPPIDFPHSDNTQAKVNARGMDIVDSLVYLCYDAGGLRVINCVDVFNPVEIEMFANPVTYVPMNMPRAYNNIIINDTVAYIAVDYCALEIIDIRDPLNLQLITHWNPVNCPSGSWYEAPVHTNELILRKECDLLFMSTGKSELIVMDIADPYLPAAVDSFGTVLDTTATWGLDVTFENVFLTYTYIPTWIPHIFVPFYSTWSGVKMLLWDNCTLGFDLKEKSLDIQIYPNPSTSQITIAGLNDSYTYRLFNTTGQLILEGYSNPENTINVTLLLSGIYFVELETPTMKVRKKMIKS